MELGAYFKSIIEQDQAPVVICDTEHTVIYMNPAAVERYGYAVSFGPSLTLFAEHHLLHLIDDGSGMQKYCVCRCGEFKCHHAHLTCTVCHETICLKDTPLPTLNILDGYLVQEAEYVIKVICPKCRKKRNQTT